MRGYQYPGYGHVVSYGAYRVPPTTPAPYIATLRQGQQVLAQASFPLFDQAKGWVGSLLNTFASVSDASISVTQGAKTLAACWPLAAGGWMCWGFG